jgi:hypothetical protein
MGKGSNKRKCQVSPEIETANWESVFGKKKLNIMGDKDREEMKIDKNLVVKEIEDKTK